MNVPKPHVNTRALRVDYLCWNPETQSWESGAGQRRPTIQQVLQSDIFAEPGAHLMWVLSRRLNLAYQQCAPSVFPEETKVENLQTNEDPLCEQLSQKFHIPPFFWTKTAWDANGFYRSRDNPLGDEHVIASHSSSFRFLIKQVELVVKPGPMHTMTGSITSQGAETVEYSWEFLGLHSIWAKLKAQAGGHFYTQILLCFDLNTRMRDGTLKHFKASADGSIINDPFEVHIMFLEPLIIEYDRTLWGFRTPIRNYEKRRLRINESEDKDRTALARRYVNMHELERHIIHSSETLRVASSTLEAMVQNHVSFNAELRSSMDSIRNTGKALRFYATFVSSLQLRARAFEERLQNEVRLAFNTVSADDSSTAKRLLEQSTRLLEQTKNDNRSLTKTVSLLTLLFLPGTFISGLFGTNFFAISTSDSNKPPQWIAVVEVWIFFAVTAPITGVFFVIWYFDLMGKTSIGFPERRGRRDKNLELRTPGSEYGGLVRRGRTDEAL